MLNIVHGTHDTVNRICDHPDIKAISFVGSNAAGKYIYERGSKNGKRVQVCSFKGAWHSVLLGIEGSVTIIWSCACVGHSSIKDGDGGLSMKT